jgi:hypothetical protein
MNVAGEALQSQFDATYLAVHVNKPTARCADQSVSMIGVNTMNLHTVELTVISDSDSELDIISCDGLLCL